MQLRSLHKIHRLRNATAKVAVRDHDSFKSDWWLVFDHIEEPPGERALDECRLRLDGFRANWEKAYPAAVSASRGRLRVALGAL